MRRSWILLLRVPSILYSVADLARPSERRSPSDSRDSFRQVISRKLWVVVLPIRPISGAFEYPDEDALGFRYLVVALSIAPSELFGHDQVPQLNRR